MSSFGVGGTNAHVVLEEAPAVSAPDIPASPQVLLLSARTAESLQESRTALAAALSGRDELRLPDVAHTLARRRKDNIRLAAVVNDQQHAAAVLSTAEDDRIFVGEAVHADAPSSSASFSSSRTGCSARRDGAWPVRVRARVRQAFRSVRRSFCR